MNRSILRAASFTATSLGFALLVALSIVVAPRVVMAESCGPPSSTVRQEPCFLGLASCADPNDECSFNTVFLKFGGTIYSCDCGPAIAIE